MHKRPIIFSRRDNLQEIQVGRFSTRRSWKIDTLSVEASLKPSEKSIASIRRFKSGNHGVLCSKYPLIKKERQIDH